MRRVLGFLMLCALLVGSGPGCSDRLSQMQSQLAGSWVLQTRKLQDGTELRAPDISGSMTWEPITSRKAHVSLNRELAPQSNNPRRFDYAVSLYEISTSAITRARHVLVRQGYRSSAKAPFSFYHKAKKEKGKISIVGEDIEISHDNQSWVFSGSTMTASYKDGWIDTWQRVQ